MRPVLHILLTCFLTTTAYSQDLIPRLALVQTNGEELQVDRWITLTNTKPQQVTDIIYVEQKRVRIEVKDGKKVEVEESVLVPEQRTLIVLRYFHEFKLVRSKFAWKDVHLQELSTGKKIDPQTVSEKLNTPSVVLITSSREKIDPAIAKMFKSSTMHLVLDPTLPLPKDPFEKQDPLKAPPLVYSIQVANPQTLSLEFTTSSSRSRLIDEKDLAGSSLVVHRVKKTLATDYPFEAVKITTADGEVPAEQWPELFAAQRRALVSVTGEPIDSVWTSALEPETNMVVVPTGTLHLLDEPETPLTQPVPDTPVIPGVRLCP